MLFSERKFKSHLLILLFYVVLIPVTGIIIFPIIWAFLTSVKPGPELFSIPFRIFPSHWIFQHYTQAVKAARLGLYTINSSVVALGSVGTNLLFCAMAGYAFAKLNFPGKNILFGLLLATMMVPIEAAVVPIFVVIRGFPLGGGNNILGQGGTGLLDSYPGLILPGAVTIYGMFLFRQFFSTLPKELEDAARIDGCSEWGIFWKIILPQSGPMLATLGILSFLWMWNDFMWPLVCIRREEMKTVQLGLVVFRQELSTDWAPLMAASILISLVPLMVFILFQKYFVKGITFTGIKG